MIVLAGLFGGGAMGAAVALKRGGKTLDALQYAAGYGIAFGILGMVVTVALNRLA